MNLVSGGGNGWRQVIAVCLMLAGWAAGASSVAVTGLRCEHADDPLGVMAEHPRFSWRMESDRPGARQTAWQVRVAGKWDSGKIAGDRSVGMVYGGDALESGREYVWQVRVWDERDQPSDWSPSARWVMGILRPEDWTAQWIAMPAVDSSIDANRVVVKRALYRTLDGRQERDVTGIVRDVVARGKLPFQVHFNALGGDPAPNVVKELRVECTIDGNHAVSRAQDFEWFTIPQVPRGNPAPWFWRDFELDGVASSAVVTVQSAAYFELQVNGVKVGKDVLAPAVSDHSKTTFFMTYDVSKLLKPGRNRMGLWVGEGWADRPVVRAQLDARIAGRPLCVATGADWKSRPSGYSRIGSKRWNDFGGERVDASQWVDGWSRAGMELAGARAVEIVTGPGGRVKPHHAPPNQLGEKIAARRVVALGGGRYEVDFGTNLTGWLEMRMPVMEVGRVVRFYYADRKFVDGKHPSPIGDVAVAKPSCTAFPRLDGGTDLYQCYNQISEWVSGGAGGLFRNQFNYAGFRYVVVEGLPAAPKLDDSTAWLVESAMASAGTFECSDEWINRIHRMNRWTLRCLNLGAYLVDCPTRERMGYGGDGQTSLPGMLMGFDSARFYEKWAGDWRDAQHGNGALPNVAPWAIGGGGPPWGGISAALPWNHFLHVGDPAILQDNFDMAKRYVESLDSRAQGEVIRAWGNGFEFLGDWVPPGRGMDSNQWPTKEMAELVNNCYRIYLWELVGNMARGLGRSDEVAHAEMRMAAIRPAVHAAFYDEANHRYVVDEQLYYVLPLRTGVTPDGERDAVMRNLVKCITEKNRGHLDTGLIGTVFLMDFLDRAGRDDLLLEMYRKRDYPGWGYMVGQGATTVWEQWNGHWSQIHGCFVSADNWLYHGLGGLRPDPDGPGFKKFIVEPPLVAGPFWVKVSHDSPYGRIFVKWERRDGEMLVDLVVPANTTATLKLPGKAGGERVVESGKHHIVMKW